MNDLKMNYLTTVLCFFTACFIAGPLSAQEETAGDPLVGEAEAEAPELTEEAEKAIERGLKFLISSQNKDGSWSSADPEKGGGGGYAIAGTSLGLMAFMVEGHFPGFGPLWQGFGSREGLPAQKIQGFPIRCDGSEDV